MSTKIALSLDHQSSSISLAASTHLEETCAFDILCYYPSPLVLLRVLENDLRSHLHVRGRFSSTVILPGYPRLLRIWHGSLIDLKSIFMGAADLIILSESPWHAHSTSLACCRSTREVSIAEMLMKALPKTIRPFINVYRSMSG